MRRISFVSCTADAWEPTPLYRSFQKLGIVEYEFREHNRRGLSECYNEWLDQYAGDDRILVMVHSDVTIADVFFDEKLSDATRRFSVVGLVGSSHFDVASPHYAWPAWPREHLSGSVEHGCRDGLSEWFHLGPTPRQCVVMDGLFLAVDMRKIGNVRFDPQFTFDLYDIDFCLSAHAAKVAMGTTNLYVQHASEGNYQTAAYQGAMQRFRRKWGA